MPSRMKVEIGLDGEVDLPATRCLEPAATVLAERVRLGHFAKTQLTDREVTRRRFPARRAEDVWVVEAQNGWNRHKPSVWSVNKGVRTPGNRPDRALD